MSKDPFEELFGPADSAEPPTEPQPVPARQRLSYEQAERVRTAQLSTEPRTARTQSGEAPRALPWIVVGVVAVVAIVVCIVLVNVVRGGEASETPKPSSSPSSTPSATPTPSAADDDDSTDAQADADGDDADDPNAVPDVEVGPTSQLQITQWNATSDLSQKFGRTQYYIEGENLQLLESPLIASLPESCAAMRTQWGATRGADGTFTLMKPAEKCAAAPEVYDEIWGLTDAFVKTIKVTA